MKKVILVLGMVLMGGLSFGQAPSWEWAKSGGGAVATDDSGNVYITGSFYRPSIIFGSIILTNTASDSTNDNYLVKYDSNGNVIWAQSSGMSNGSEITSFISIDVSGNIYVGGYFTSPVFVLGNDTLTNSGGTDLFIAKYNSAGNVLWAKSAGGASDDYINSITTSASGKIYITGWFMSPSIVFGSATLFNTTSNNMFTVRYDSIGTVLWAKTTGGNSNPASSSVSADASGVYVTGGFDSTFVVFGTDTLRTDSAYYNMFVVKYDTNGNILWAKTSGGSDGSWGNSLSANPSGIYVAGSFASHSITFGGTTLTNDSVRNMFIVKYDANGTVIWAKSPANTCKGYAGSVTADTSGIYVLGMFDVPTLLWGSTILTDEGSGDIYLVKFDNFGNVLWAKSAGGIGYEGANTVAVDLSGNIYTTAFSLSTSVAFGTITLTNPDTLGYGFLAKLNKTTSNIFDLTTSSQLNIYPNPATTNLTIAFAKNTKKVVLIITDIAGKLIYTATAAETEKMNVTTNGFAEGIYIVKIQTEEGVETKKLIVQK